MLISTVVAVALGVAPIKQDAPTQIVSGDYSGRIGRYSQSVDGGGATHIIGRDRNGAPYELTIDRNGNVEGSVANHVVNFHVQDQG
jgi:hypothetical protein